MATGGFGRFIPASGATAGRRKKARHYTRALSRGKAARRGKPRGAARRLRR
jgi:hypothetical protein